jgi:hypothetical protein
MSKRSIGYALFAVFMVIMVTGPGGGGKPRRGRGVGCSGGVRVGGAGGNGPQRPTPPRPVPQLPAKSKFAPKPIFKVPGDPYLRLSALLGLAAAGVRSGELPAVVGRPLEAPEVVASSLKDLGRLRNLVHDPWPQSVKVEEVEAGVAAYAKTAAPQETAAMRRYLVLRARMEGQPDVAGRLLPPGEALETQSLLRDLSRLEEINATPPPTSPLGDLPLPEPPPLGLKAPVREALYGGLPGLGEKLPGEELPRAELRARRGAVRAIEISAGAHWHRVRVTLNLHIHESSASASEPDDRENEVERQLDRPLRPEERLLARRLLRTRRPAEVAAALRPLAQK